MKSRFLDLIRMHIEMKRDMSSMRKNAYAQRWLADYINRNFLPKGKIMYDMSKTMMDILVNRLAKEISKKTTGTDYDEIMRNTDSEAETGRFLNDLSNAIRSIGIGK